MDIAKPPLLNTPDDVASRTSAATVQKCFRRSGGRRPVFRSAEIPGFLRIQAFRERQLLQSCHFRDDDGVSALQGIDEFRLEDISPRGAGTRFEDRPRRRDGNRTRNARSVSADGGGVMAEVVHDGDSPTSPRTVIRRWTPGTNRSRPGSGWESGRNAGRRPRRRGRWTLSSPTRGILCRVAQLEFGRIRMQRNGSGADFVFGPEPESFHRTRRRFQQIGEIGPSPLAKEKSVSRDQN